MNEVETVHTNASLEATKQQFAIASAEGIDSLRLEEQQTKDKASRAALQDLTWHEALSHGAQVDKEARAEAANQFEAELGRRLGVTISREEQPELFDKFLGHLKKYSATNMSEATWLLGEADSEGYYANIDSQGYVRAQDDFDRICEEILATHQAEDYESRLNPDVPEVETPLIGENQKELEGAQARLAKIRAHLAALSVHRRQMIRKRSNKALGLQEAYEATEIQYKAASLRVGMLRAHRERLLDRSEEQLRAAVIHHILNEHQAFTEAEAHVLDQDDSRRGRFYRFLARKHNLLGASALTGFGIGLASRKFITGATLGTAVGIAAPIALAAGAAVRSTKAVLAATVGNHVDQIRLLEQRAGDDFSHLRSKVLPVALADVTNVDEMVAAGDQHLCQKIAERIERDRKYNRNRVIQAAAVSGALAAGGVLMADFVLNGHHGGVTPRSPSQHPSPSPQPQPTPSPTPHAPTPIRPPSPEIPGPNIVDGYNTNVIVEHGHGFTNELKDLAAQKGNNLSGRNAWLAYLALVHHFPQLHGNFFTNDHSYLSRAGDYRISRPGNAHWDPAVVDYFNRWFQQHVATS